MFGAVWAQAELRKVLGALGARVVDRELPLTLGDDAWHGARRARRATTQREALAEHVGALLGALAVSATRRGARRGRPSAGGASARPASCAGRR